MTKEERYEKALKQIVELEVENPKLNSMHSMGNYDDVFEDGTTQGTYYGKLEAAKIAKDALAEG